MNKGLAAVVGGTILGTVTVGLVFTSLSNAQTRLEGQYAMAEKTLERVTKQLEQLQDVTAKQIELTTGFRYTLDEIKRVLARINVTLDDNKAWHSLHMERHIREGISGNQPD